MWLRFHAKKSAEINDVKTWSSFDYASNVNWCANSKEAQFTKMLKTYNVIDLMVD